MKNSFQLLVEILAAVDEMHDHQFSFCINAVGDPVLRSAHGKMKRVQHMKRAGEPLAGERVAFERDARIRG